jgi:hypothetical protein
MRSARGIAAASGASISQARRAMVSQHAAP